jgi:hypothetical protein
MGPPADTSPYLRCNLYVMPDDEKTAGNQDERSAFQRFEDFARKLIAVPKSEMDEQDEKETP